MAMLLRRVFIKFDVRPLFVQPSLLRTMSLSLCYLHKRNHHHLNPHFGSSTVCLSNPRAKRAGPKGLCAESARAVTGRQCPHSEEAEDFLTQRPFFFYENGCNSGTESRKIVPKVGN